MKCCILAGPSLFTKIWPGSTISSETNCRSMGREFGPRQVQFFCGDWSWNIFYGNSPPTADFRRIGVNYKRKYVHEVMVNRLVKLAQEKSVVTWTDCLGMAIAVDWDVKPQSIQNIRTRLGVSSIQTVNILKTYFKIWISKVQDFELSHTQYWEEILDMSNLGNYWCNSINVFSY